MIQRTGVRWSCRKSPSIENSEDSLEDSGCEVGTGVEAELTLASRQQQQGATGKTKRGWPDGNTHESKGTWGRRKVYGIRTGKVHGIASTDRAPLVRDPVQT